MNTWDESGYGHIMSDANRAAIRARRSPVVDEAWIKAFPEDAGLAGERIIIAHIGGYPFVVPLPHSRHMDSHFPGGTRYNHGGPGSAAPFYPKE
jgi:filamentous hemagglutinin